MKRQRRNHSPQFKAKVALEAATEERTVAELSRQAPPQPPALNDAPQPEQEVLAA